MEVKKKEYIPKLAFYVIINPIMMKESQNKNKKCSHYSIFIEFNFKRK